MKTILFILISIGASAQSFSDQVYLAKDRHYYESIYVRADTMTVREGFEYLNKLASGRLWFVNRYVIKNDTVYLRYGMTLTRKRTFIVHKNGKKHIKL